MKSESTSVNNGFRTDNPQLFGDSLAKGLRGRRPTASSCTTFLTRPPPLDALLNSRLSVVLDRKPFVVPAPSPSTLPYRNVYQ
uniref:Uncharacterized protein n=1 Tax=Steinernema glaseri TaxID=37863 RepID=A0A1I7YYT1_9BILA